MDEKKKVSVERLDVDRLSGFAPAYVKCVQAGNVTEFICLENIPSPVPVIKIDKDHYMNLDTSEVFEYTHGENKSFNYQSVRRTLANLRGIINANCIDENKIRWVTLTYAENMTDTKRLYKDFEHFWKRFCRWCKKQNIAKPEYIAVAEPQGRGAWHMHIILIFADKAPYIANNEVLAPLWGQGFTKIKAVHGCDNIGAYFSAYLADMPLEDFQKVEKPDVGGVYRVKELSDDEGSEGKKKAFVKGGRLHLYPSGMNIYRCSRGVLQPNVITMGNDEYQNKKASVGALTFSHACKIVSADNLRKNIILHEYYNAKSNKRQV